MRKKVLALALALVMMTAVFAGCGSDNKAGEGPKNVDETKNVVNATAGPEPETIDPTLNNTADGAIYITEFFEGLMRMDKDGKIVKGVAKEYKVSDDGINYTFTIRDDAKWSDGQPVKAQDFEYSWKRAADPKTAAYYSSMMAYLKNGDEIVAGKMAPTELGVKAKDDKTLEVTLKAPCAYFLELMHFPTFMPLRKDILEKYTDKWTQSPESYISNGPYKMKDWKHNSEIVMVKNENYWDKAMERKISEVHWKLTDDHPAALNAFEAGELDYNDGLIPPEELPNLIADGKTTAVPEIGTNYVTFNISKPPLDNPKVRKALSLAIDRKYIAEKVLQGGQKVAEGYVPFGIPGFDNKKDFRTEEGSENFYKPTADIEAAKKMLAEAGYPDGKGLPELEYSTNTNASNNKVAEALQAQWAKIGVKVKINTMEWKVFGPFREEHKHMICRDAWSSDYMDAMSFLELGLTGNPNNYSGYSNPEYDALIKKAQVTIDTKERAMIMHQAEKMFIDDAPATMLCYRNKNSLLNPKLKGVHLNPLGYVMFEYAYWEK